MTTAPASATLSSRKRAQKRCHAPLLATCGPPEGASSSVAEVTSAATVSALVGSSAAVATTGTLKIDAKAINTAHAKSDVGSGGLVGVAASNLTATVAGGTLATMDGTVSKAKAVALGATAAIGKNDGGRDRDDADKREGETAASARTAAS